MPPERPFLGDGVRKLGHAKFSHAPAFDNLLMCSSTNGASRSGAWVLAA
jgi:hypothetical protein